MGDPPVLRLYPTGGTTCPVPGLYLAHDLRALARTGGTFVYTNFIASLDGRISETVGGRRQVPAAIANPRDWRLYMELLAQSDAVLTSTRHLRAIAAGRQRELLDLGRGPFVDLGEWRRDRGLAPLPKVVVMSAALDIPSDIEARLGTELVVVTCGAAPASRVAALTSAGIEPIICGSGARVDAGLMVEALGARGIGILYSVAGPMVLHALTEAGAVNRLYLTLAQTLLGGERFDTLLSGPVLAPPAGLRLHELYLDAHAPPGAGQLLMSFERTEARAPAGS